MEIKSVTSKGQIADFHRVPFDIYRRHPGWVPHLKQDVEKVFDPQKNKAWRHGEAIRWVLYQNDRPIGRVAAFVNEKYSKGMDFPTGGMGFFEAPNDPEAARLLLQTAEDWLRDKGMEAMDGPINFGEKNMFWGLLVANFKDLGSYGMNFNPEYYVPFFQEFGFQTYYNQYCYWRDLKVPAQQVFVDKAERLSRDPKFRVTNARKMNLDQIAEAFVTVYNNAWGGHHGFKKMNKAQGQKMIKAMKPVMDKDILVFGWYGEDPISFYINIPELNQIFDKVGGDLNLIGKLKFLYHKLRHTPTTMVGLVFGVARNYHGRGVEGAMIKFAEERIVSLDRYSDTVLTWIGDFNPKMMKISENLGASRYRTLQTMRKIFDNKHEFKRMPVVQ